MTLQSSTAKRMKPVCAWVVRGSSTLKHTDAVFTGILVHVFSHCGAILFNGAGFFFLWFQQKVSSRLPSWCHMVTLLEELQQNLLHQSQTNGRQSGFILAPKNEQQMRIFSRIVC